MDIPDNFFDDDPVIINFRNILKIQQEMQSIRKEMVQDATKNNYPMHSSRKTQRAITEAYAYIEEIEFLLKQRKEDILEDFMESIECLKTM